jgi:hypothetical protein
METLIVKPKNKKQLDAVEAVLKALNVAFKKEEEKAYNEEYAAKIEKSSAEIKADKTTKIRPADIWNLG